MKYCRNLTEFYHKNDKDLTNILNKKFKYLLKYYDIEDIKSEIYMRLHAKKYVENFRPLEIHVDPDTGEWTIKKNHAKFSTYICKFLFNYVYAYYKTIKPDELHASLEEYNDSGYNEHKTKIQTKQRYNPTSHINLKIELEQLAKNMEKKQKFIKGTYIVDNKAESNIIKYIDSFGETGCLKKELYTFLAKKEDLTNLEEGLLDIQIEAIKKKGYISESLNEYGEEFFLLGDLKKRSITHLLSLYKKGFKDKDISEKFKMTFAGVGALKKTLRKEIKYLRNGMN